MCKQGLLSENPGQTSAPAKISAGIPAAKAGAFAYALRICDRCRLDSWYCLTKMLREYKRTVKLARARRVNGS